MVPVQANLCFMLNQFSLGVNHQLTLIIMGSDYFGFPPALALLSLVRLFSQCLELLSDSCMNQSID